LNTALFGSDLWKPALDKYAEATGLSVELFGMDGRVVLNSMYATPLVELFREYGSEPGLFAECAHRCLKQTHARPAVVVDERHGLTVVGTSLVLEGRIVGVAVAGYALAQFCQVAAVQRWANSVGVPFYRLWDVVRRLPPVPERRLLLHGELLQVLGDALLRENYRTRQYEDTVEKLEAASAAKDEFLAVLSHELRTPLAPIAGWASVLRKGKSLKDVQRAAAAIERNAFLQSRLIDDLLDVSRIAHGGLGLALEVLELPACTRAALETLAQDIEEKAIGVDFVDAGEPLPVEGDAGRMQQVFRNIFSNAVKFTPSGGQIRITLGREANDAVVVVADTGKGVTPEFLPFVFDIFRQQEQGIRREHGGLGIGLALVKKLIELHQGTVSLASAGAGRGTSVTIRLPLAAGTPEACVEDAEPGTISLAGLRVLVVDDVQDARETLQLLLERLGAEVSVAGSGREALAMMQGAAPDLVLCDLRMPRLDGFGFIQELQREASSAHPPVVAVSALASDADRQRTRDAGFRAHLKKPFDEAALVAAVGAALDHRKEQRLPASQMQAPRPSG
jgi:signal transduction histidine kinase/ActR/RegA family two-component response regulator